MPAAFLFFFFYFFGRSALGIHTNILDYTPYTGIYKNKPLKIQMDREEVIISPIGYLVISTTGLNIQTTEYSV